MKKYCSICGREINENELYYSVFSDGYVCSDPECYDIYFWNYQTERLVKNKWHDYALIDGKLYQFGSNDDEPRGFGGRHWHVHFFDGTERETNSLWLIGDLPEHLKQNFSDNAQFID